MESVQQDFLAVVCRLFAAIETAVFAVCALNLVPIRKTNPPGVVGNIYLAFSLF